MKNKIFIACDSTNISKIKEIIKKTKTSKLKIGYKFGLEFLNSKDGRVFVSNDPKKVANNSDCIITDTWISMGEDKKKSTKKFQPYQVNQSLMSLAKPDAVFMHCLPAYRGFEVTNDVINSNKSVVFDQAENRIHAQKSILDFCFML